MDNKNMTINELIPLYYIESKVLIGLKEDYAQGKVDDGLVLELDLNEKRIVDNPWSGQKKLKFGYYYAVEENEKQELLRKIQASFDELVLREMVDLLLNPSLESVKSLVWLPERLINR
jgi:hypothetical protein